MERQVNSRLVSYVLYDIVSYVSYVSSCTVSYVITSHHVVHQLSNSRSFSLDDVCVSSGLTPPTTPPHKPVEDELFKPADSGKVVGGCGGGSTSDGGGGESVHLAANSNGNARRPHHQRKLPEQTELYAQLRRMAGEGDSCCNFGDHDYCVLSLGESRKRSAALLGAILQVQRGDVIAPELNAADDQRSADVSSQDRESLVRSEVEEPQEQTAVMSPSLPAGCQSAAATPPVSEEEAERSSVSRSPSPVLHLCPDSPASKTDSR